MLSKWIHHLTLHFPIVLTFCLALLGVWTAKEETEKLRSFMRWMGWFTLIMTSIAAIAGILQAPGMFGGDGTDVLRDHRDLGVTAWCIVALAAWSYNEGYKRQERDWRLFGISMWGVACLATFGASHWGGLHKNLLPF